MNEREQAALDALLKSKNYACVYPDAVRRAFETQLARHKTLKEAEKAARAQLHQLTGAFMTPQQLKSAQALMGQYAAGDQDALWRALKLHASTAERLEGMRALFARAFESLGGGTVLDLACGLNPLYLGHAGKSVVGLDVNMGAVDLINRWAAAAGWDVRARGADLTKPDAPLEKTGCALAMKLLPVLERSQKGAAMALLLRVSAPRILVSFPTRTLGGRSVGMAGHYTRWFEENLPGQFCLLDRFVEADELCYTIKRKSMEE